jgi:hypothetical protein
MHVEGHTAFGRSQPTLWITSRKIYQKKSCSTMRYARALPTGTMIRKFDGVGVLKGMM